jgi:hypothetical protein
MPISNSPAIRALKMTVAILVCFHAGPGLCGAAEGMDEYALFRDGNAGTSLLRVVANAFLGSAPGLDGLLLPPSPRTGRPAGPRDEPPPPEWPAKPVGLVFCIEVEGRIRGCEGVLDPGARELGAIAGELGERLATSRSRGRKKLSNEEFEIALIRGAFIPGATDRAGFAEAKDAYSAGEMDLAKEGIVIEGSRGRVFVMPGEAASLREAVRLARKGRAVKVFRKPLAVYRFKVSPIGPGFRIKP